MKIGDWYEITSLGIKEDEDLFSNSFAGDAVCVVDVELDNVTCLVESDSTMNRFYLFKDDIEKGWVK